MPGKGERLSATKVHHASIPESRRPFEPERNYSRMNAPSPQESEVPLTDVLTELRIIEYECRQLRTQVGNVAPTESIGMRETGFRETTSRQNELTARMDRTENHLNVIAQDQNSAAQSNQALLGQCADHVRRLQDRFHDIPSLKTAIGRWREYWQLISGTALIRSLGKRSTKLSQ